MAKLLLGNNTLRGIREYKHDIEDMTWYYRRHSFAWFGLVIPVTAVVGMAGCLATWLVYHHPKLKGFSALVMQMVAFADVVSMASVFALYFPPMWLPYRFDNILSTEFLHDLTSIQQRYVFVYPVAGLSHSMIAWYTVIYIGEYYFSITSPCYLLEFSKRGNMAKVLMTVFNLTVIVHVMCYFCLTTDKAYNDALVAKRICLSDVFGRPSVQHYDKYLYVFLSFICPWLVALGCLSLIGYKIKHRPEQTDVTAQQDTSLSPGNLAVILNGGRSRRLLVAMGSMFVALEGASIVVYMAIVDTIDFADNPKACHVLPEDRRFMHADKRFELAYVLLYMMQSVLRFPMCVWASKAFRESLMSAITGMRAALRRVCRTIHTVGKWHGVPRSKDIKPPETQYRITVVSTLPPGGVSTNGPCSPEVSQPSHIMRPAIIITQPQQPCSFYNPSLRLDDEPGIEI